MLGWGQEVDTGSGVGGEEPRLWGWCRFCPPWVTREGPGVHDI